MVTLIDESSEGRWTKQRAAQEALTLEHCTNTAEILRIMYEIYRAYLLDGTSAANHSIPMRFASHVLSQFTSRENLFELADYVNYRDECQKIAGTP